MKAPKSDIERVLEIVQRIDTRLRHAEIRIAVLAATVAILVHLTFP